MNRKRLALSFIAFLILLPYFVYTPSVSAAEDTREQSYKEYNPTSTKSGISLNIGSSGKVIENWEVTHNGTILGKIGSISGDTLSLPVLNGTQKIVYGKKQTNPGHIVWRDSAGTTWNTGTEVAGVYYITGACLVGGVSECPGPYPSSVHSDLQQSGMAVTTARNVQPADQFYFSFSDIGDINAQQIPSSKVSPSSIKINKGYTNTDANKLSRNINILDAGNGIPGYGMIRIGKLLNETNNEQGVDYQIDGDPVGYAEGRNFNMKVDAIWEGITYEYSGTVKVTYKQIGPDPVATVSCSSPATVNFYGSDISLQVTVTAKIWNVPASSVSNLVLNAKSQNETFTGASIERTKIFTVVIPADDIPLGSSSHSVSTGATVKLTNNATYSGTCTTTTVIWNNPNPNKPPVAVLMAPDEVRVGDEFMLSGYGSYDLDGTITDYFWGTAGLTGTITGGGGGPVYYASTGEKRVTLAVLDNEGAGGGTEKLINVIAPYVYAQFTVAGTKKENRKVTLSSTTSSPSRYPVVETKWTITAISGGTATDIKVKGASTDASIDTLFKKEGEYKVSFYARNSAGYTDTINTILVIAPDLQPVAEFSVPTWIYSNPSDSNFALMDIRDASRSNDGDIIKSHILSISYNGNNNYYSNSIVVDENDREATLKAKSIYSKFDDDPSLEINILTMNVNQSYSYTTNGISITALKTSDGKIQLKSKHVGRYLIEMRTAEDFGQPTIPEFVTEADYRSNNTSSKPLLEKILTIGNRAPTVNFKP